MMRSHGWRATSRSSLRSPFGSALVGIARAAVPLIAAAASTCAFAHPGHDAVTAGGSLWSGLLHPFSGMDHLLAMVSVGTWSALSVRSAREALRIPLAFVALMLAGAALGLGGVALPAVEPMIAASLLVLGLLLALRAKLPAWAGMAVVGGFAVFHGYAHGSELPVSADPLPAALYVAGFTLATVTLHLLGIGLGSALRRQAGWLVRAAGAGVALYGAGLLMA